MLKLARSLLGSLNYLILLGCAALVDNFAKPAALRRLAITSIRKRGPRGALSELSSKNIAELCEVPIHRALILSRFTGTPAQAIQLAVNDATVPLVRAALTRDDVGRRETSTALYDAIVLNRATTGEHGLQASLLATSDLAGQLVPEHEKAIFQRALAITRRPFNPYMPSGVAISARLAAGALLVVDSSLDSVATAAVQEDPANAQPVLDVVGGALRGRDTDRANAVASILSARVPSESEAQEFGELCDSGFSAADPVIYQEDRAGAGIKSWWAVVARHVAPVIVGPCLAAAIYVAHHNLRALPAGVAIEPAAALGAFALLLATHVVSAQLSAERLPGPLARFSSQPASVVAGYSAGIAMVVAAWLGASKNADPDWMLLATGELVAFAIFLGATLITLTRRTDTVTAAIGFGQDRRVSFSASGRRLGKIQHESIEVQKELEALPWIRFGGSIPLNVRREPIRAEEDGFSSIRRGQLPKLGKQPAWRQRDLVLHVGGGLGTLVHRGRELASIVPGGNVELSERELARAKRIFRVHDDTGIEEATEALASLARLTGQLAAEGNPGGSNRVADVLLDLLERQLSASHAARNPISSDLNDAYPVNLPLQSVLTYATRRIGETESAAEEQALQEILRRALGMSKPGDSAPAMVATALPTPKGRSLKPAEREVLWHAGMQAIVLGARYEWSIVSSTVEAHLRGSSPSTALVELAGRLVIYTIWVDQFAAEPRWKWFWSRTANDKSGERIICALRAGGAALLAGCISSAIRISLDLRGQNLQNLRDYFKEEEVSARESFLSGLHGFLLSADPEQAILNFLDFAESVQTAVK